MTVTEAQKLFPGAKFSCGPGEGENVIDVVKEGLPVLSFTPMKPAMIMKLQYK